MYLYYIISGGICFTGPPCSAGLYCLCGAPSGIVICFSDRLIRPVSHVICLFLLQPFDLFLRLSSCFDPDSFAGRSEAFVRAVLDLVPRRLRLPRLPFYFKGFLSLFQACDLRRSGNDLKIYRFGARVVAPECDRCLCFADVPVGRVCHSIVGALLQDSPSVCDRDRGRQPFSRIRLGRYQHGERCSVLLPDRHDAVVFCLPRLEGDRDLLPGREPRDPAYDIAALRIDPGRILFSVDRRIDLRPDLAPAVKRCLPIGKVPVAAADTAAFQSIQISGFIDIPLCDDDADRRSLSILIGRRDRCRSRADRSEPQIAVRVPFPRILDPDRFHDLLYCWISRMR